MCPRNNKLFGEDFEATLAGPSTYRVIGPDLSPIGGLLDEISQNLDVCPAGTDWTHIAGSVRFFGEEVQLGGACTTEMGSQEFLRRGRALFI